jgi:hypothetical protein
MKQIYLSGAARTVLVACVAAAALAACNKNGQATSAPTPAAALPMVMTATGPTAIAPAPTVNNLPTAPPVRVGRLSDPGDTYAYADQADAENDAFGDAPPDYGFDYDGTQPWVWYGDDRSERVCEPLPGGGYRYYYFQPGAQYPYLVRDPEYTYGYDSGVLVVVYDRFGEAMPQGAYGRRLDAASRILARGTDLYLASQRQQHQAVVAANWEARQNRIAADNAAWQRGQRQQSGWAAYHAAHAPQEQAQWDQERFRREAEAARFAQATNHPEVAQRDWQAAQQAHAHAPQAGPGLFGLHLGGPKPPATVVAAPGAPPAPTAAPPNGRPAGDHRPEGHGPPPQPSAAPAPTIGAPTPGGPTHGGPQAGGPPAGSPGQGGGHHDHGAGPPGGAGPGQPARVEPAPVRSILPAPAAPKPELHAAPVKPATLPSIFHPQAPAAPVAPPRVVQRAIPSAPPPRAPPPHAIVAAPPAPPPRAPVALPKVFERPAAPIPRAEVVRPPPAVVRAPPPAVVRAAPPAVVRAVPPVVRAAPVIPHPAAVALPRPPAAKPDEKHPPQ